jgi:hypothetical protein
MRPYILERFTMSHCDAACQPGSCSTSKILWRRAANVAQPSCPQSSTCVGEPWTTGGCSCGLFRPQETSQSVDEGRTRRPIFGRVPIVAAIITAAGAVIAAVVAGAFHILS